MNEEEKKALKVINARTRRLLDELEIEKEDMSDEPKIAYLMQEIRANKTILNLIEKLQKENEEWQRAYQEEKDRQFDLIKENEKLKEYIAKAPNLDEMSATKYRNIQQEAYIQGRAEEQRKARKIIYENYILKKKIKDKIEELKQEDRNWTEELSEPDGNFKIIDRNLKRIKNQIDVLQELIEESEEK